MDIKHREVMQWLKEVYGAGEILPFEKTERSVDLLHELMLRSKTATLDAKTLHNDFENKASEYHAEGQQVTKWMSTLNLHPAMLSQLGQKMLSSVTNIQNALDIECPSTTNVLLGLNQLDTSHSQVLMERETERRRMENLLTLNQTVATKLQKLQKIYDQSEASAKIQKETMEKESKRKNFSLAKIEDYKEDLKICEAKLKHIGFNSDIVHHDLVTRANEVEDLENQVKNLDKKLSTYTLPPDLALAQFKVEETRQTHNEILQNIASVYKSNH